MYWGSVQDSLYLVCLFDDDGAMTCDFGYGDKKS